MVDIPQTIHSTPQSKLTSQSVFDDPEDENDNEADVTKLIDKVNEMYHDLVGDNSHFADVITTKKRKERKKKERRKERKAEREKGGKRERRKREKGGKRERRKERKEEKEKGEKRQRRCD